MQIVQLLRGISSRDELNDGTPQYLQLPVSALPELPMKLFPAINKLSFCVKSDILTTYPKPFIVAHMQMQERGVH